MSERKVIQWNIESEYGEHVRTVEVVYYEIEKECPACKGIGELLHDNRDDLDFGASVWEDKHVSIPPLSDPCFLCKGDGRQRVVDKAKMTEKQIDLYGEFMKHLEEVEEKLKDEKTGAKLQMARFQEDIKALREEERS